MPRSRSLRRANDHTSDTRRRSRSPDSSHLKRKRSPAPHALLPLHALYLSKHHFATSKPMFALYLEIQKQLVLEDLPEKEVRGRWKSFVGKWNRGELAEGWYDPATLHKATDSATRGIHSRRDSTGRRRSSDYGDAARRDTPKVESSDDEDIGPALPGGERTSLSRGHQSGPAIPNMQDLELQRELAAEDNASTREDLRYQRAMNRKQEKEKLEELAPRAEAGSKERMLEKKKEKAAVNRAFASAKTDIGGVVEVPEAELLGDDDGGIEGFKKQKREMERKKNEREIRKEEVLRARAEEREERVKQYKAKEEATMKGLIELAKARFG